MRPAGSALISTAAFLTVHAPPASSIVPVGRSYFLAVTRAGAETEARWPWPSTTDRTSAWTVFSTCRKWPGLN
jgi:hypothetical protein